MATDFTNILAWYKFEEYNTGCILDSSLHGDRFVRYYIGGYIPAITPFLDGNGVKFVGSPSGEYLYSTYTGFAYAGNKGISFQFKPDTLPPEVFGKSEYTIVQVIHNSDATKRFTIIITWDGRIVVQFSDATSGKKCTDAGVIIAGQTYNIAINWNTSSVEIYINGVSQSLSNGWALSNDTEYFSNGVIVLGANLEHSADYGSDHYDGLLDNVAIWNRVITSTEVSYLNSNNSNIDNTLNLPPVANDQSVSTNENEALAITLTATDPESQSLSYSVLSSPSHGVLSGTAPNLTYTPTSYFSGTDSFTFRANDGVNNSNTATISITIVGIVYSIYYVDGVSGDDDIDGGNWARSFKTINKAISLMDGSAKTIKIKGYADGVSNYSYFALDSYCDLVTISGDDGNGNAANFYVTNATANNIGAGRTTTINNMVVSGGAGVYLKGNLSNCISKNSSTHGFTVDVNNLSLSNCSVENATSNGFNITSNNNILNNCSVDTCGGDGFVDSGSGNALTNCDVINATGKGFNISDTTVTMSNCNNEDSLSDGFRISGDGDISDCVSNGAGGDGFNLGSPSVLTSCTSIDSVGNGFTFDQPMTFNYCSSLNSGVYGFEGNITNNYVDGQHIIFNHNTVNNSAEHNIYIHGAGTFDETRIIDNIISNCGIGKYGVYNTATNSTGMKYTYNLSYRNSAGHYNENGPLLLSVINNIYDEDPLYNDIPLNDMRLKFGSPAIGTSYTDTQMGAYDYIDGTTSISEFSLVEFDDITSSLIYSDNELGDVKCGSIVLNDTGNSNDFDRFPFSDTEYSLCISNSPTAAKPYIDTKDADTFTIKIADDLGTVKWIAAAKTEKICFGGASIIRRGTITMRKNKADVKFRLPFPSNIGSDYYLMVLPEDYAAPLMLKSNSKTKDGFTVYCVDNLLRNTVITINYIAIVKGKFRFTLK